MDTQDAPKGPVTTVRTLLEIVQVIHRRDGVTTKELAEELNLAKSTVHRHLETLYKSEYIVKKNGKFYLGLRFLEMGMDARNRMELYNVAKPRINDLAQDSGHAVWCVVEEFGQAVYLGDASGKNAVRTHARVGKREPLHCLAAGKVIMAYLPPERIGAIIESRGLEPKTNHTITDREELFAELEEIREQGYGLNDNEIIEGVRAVAAPVFKDETILGAIALSAPMNRLKDNRFRQEIPDMLLGTTNEIELRLTYSEQV